VVDEYRTMCDTLGRTVRVERADAPSIEGTAVDITGSGSLVVEAEGGRREVASGDVVHLRATDPDGGFGEMRSNVRPPGPSTSSSS
jgi:biotin-(acetyl-CoA carboxylase) ligase